jgi:hypothetical protein
VSPTIASFGWFGHPRHVIAREPALCSPLNKDVNCKSQPVLRTMRRFTSAATRLARCIIFVYCDKQF